MFCSPSFIWIASCKLFVLPADAALIQQHRQYGPALMRRVPGYRLNALFTNARTGDLPLTYTAKHCHLAKFYTAILTPEGTSQRERMTFRVSSKEVKKIHWVSWDCSCTPMNLRAALKWTAFTWSMLKWLYHTLEHETLGVCNYLWCI